MASPEDDARVAYALIDKSWGLPLSNDGKSSPYSLHPPSDSDQSAVNGVSPVSLTSMDQWYEYFAVRTPSNGYLARVEEMGNDRVRQQQAKKESKSGGGWFSRLFGRSDDKKSCLDEKNEADEAECESDDNIPQQLKLDVNAINHEARAFHRFHLASEQRALVSSNSSGEKEGHCVIIPVRMSIGWDDIESMSGDNKQTHLCIVGYGQIAEFPSLPETSFASLEQQVDTDNTQTKQNIDAAKISLTSDHNELLSFVTKLDKDQPLPLYDLRHCRAASIGSDCIIILWGLGGDGSIVFYRRIEPQKSPRDKRVGFENVPTVGWVAVAYATPSDSVIEAGLHNMTPDPCFSGGYEHRQQEHNISRLYELGSLRGSDLVPMVFNISNAPTAMLAISRLGGFMELLPLPSWIWLDKMNVLPRKLVDLSAASTTTAFSTSIHHTDILSVDAYRTRVGTGMQRNEIHGGPLAEFVLVASGQHSIASQDGQEFLDETAFSGAVLSFWSIAVIQSNDQRGAGFDLGVTCIQRCDINNLGADSSVFITGSTVEHWSELDLKDAQSEDRTKRQYISRSLSIISTHVPITSLRFAPSISPESNMNHGVLLAALDCNGGVTVLDCSQCIYSIEDLDMHDSANGTDALKNHTQIVLLSGREVSLVMQSNASLCRASQIEWWRSPSLFAAANNGQYHDQSLVDPGSLGTFYLATNTAVQPMQNNSDPYNAVRLQKWVLTSNHCSDLSDPIEVFCIPSSRQNTATILLPMKYQTIHGTLSLLEMTFASHQLSVCGIRKCTDPTEIITVLLHQSDPTRALDVARSFGGAEHFGSAIMNKCQIQLWEEQRNVEALKLVSDHEYVVREALGLEKSLKADTTGDIMTMGHLTEIYREALWRLDELRSGSHSANPEWLSSSAARLRKYLRLVGTFKLLIQHLADNGMLDGTFETNSLVTRFLHGFCLFNLFDVASSAASRGDINTLTIILARHPASTHIRMNLLELIPLDIDVSFYEHLLPCSADDYHKDGLFLPKSQVGLPKQFLNPLEMFLFLSGGNGPDLSVAINEADEDFVIKHFRDDSESFSAHVAYLPPSKEDVAFWYLKTCLGIHGNTKDVGQVKRFCELALVRLGFVSFAEDGTYEISTVDDLSACGGSSSVGKLAYLYYAADLLNRITVDKMKASIVGPPASAYDWAETELFPSIKQFCSMSTPDALSFLLDNAGPSSNTGFFENCIAHFFFGGECLAPGGNDGLIKSDAKSGGLQYDAILELCLDKLKQTKSRKRKSADARSSNDIFRLQQSLSVCAMFASFASNKWDEDDLVSFACQIFNCTMKVVGEDWSIVVHGVIDHLWSIFETIPSTSLSNPQTKLVVLNLQLRLVMIQLCSKWGRHRLISHSVRTFVCSETASHSQEESATIAAACSDLLATVARGFCEYAVGQYGHRRDLLLDFISDISEVDKQYFSSHAEKTGSIGAVVLPLLLKQELFIMLRELLRVRPGWFCRDHTRGVLLSYIRANEMQSKSASVKCLEALGALFPELVIEVERQHRFHDAKMFAKNEMSMGSEMLAILFSEQHSRSPISFTKSLLSHYPESLVIGCEFWSDQMGAERACADAASYFISQIDAIFHQTAFDEGSHVLPPMPGALVMQLSNIIGQLDSLEALRVKQFMVVGVLELGLIPAAIAICFSMLCDAAFARQKSNGATAPGAKWTNEHEDVVQHCVVASVSRAPSNITQIEKDLCAQSLRLFGAYGSPLQHALLELFSSLEYEEIGNRETAVDSLVGNDSDVSPRQQSEFLVFKAAELVARQAKDFVEHSIQSRTTATPNPFYELSLVFNELSKESGTDIRSLRSSLRKASSADGVNQELSDLSQVFLNWSVDCAFKLTDHSALSAAKIRMIVELGASCLAALTNAKTAALVIDMSIEEFKAALATSKSTNCAPSSVKPDPALTQRLHERGYGWNAARRACIMVNNRGYSEALRWAVAHFQDEDFDSPIFLLNNGHSTSLSQDLISLVGGLLQSIKAHHDKSSKNTSMKQVSMKTSIAKMSRAAQARPASDGSQSERKTLLVSNQSTSQAPLLQPTIPIPSLSDKSQNESVPKDSSNQAPPPLNPSVPALAPDSAVEKVSAPPANKSVPPVQTSMSPSQLNPFLRTPTNDSNAGYAPNSGDSMSMSSFDGSLGSRASIKRQVNIGKVIGTKNLSAEDRKRLASEGRRLLEAARRKNKSVVAPPTSIVTKPIPRP
jgi:hypothetical protein